MGLNFSRLALGSGDTVRSRPLCTVRVPAWLVAGGDADVCITLAVAPECCFITESLELLYLLAPGLSWVESDGDGYPLRCPE